MRVNANVFGLVSHLGEVRGAVAREWSNDKRKSDERFSRLLKRYEVTIESGRGAQAAASP